MIATWYNQAYKAGRFQDAVEGHLHLIKNGLENGHIYYNLGNASLRLGDLGKAILIFASIGVSSLALKWYQLKTDDRAVILAGEVDVLAGPHPQDTVLFKLHEGAIVHHERSEDGWCLIHSSSERRGWIRSEDLEKVIVTTN